MAIRPSLLEQRPVLSDKGSLSNWAQFKSWC
jgi:hypothetical protein